jgi:hypothetical protein
MKIEDQVVSLELAREMIDELEEALEKWKIEAEYQRRLKEYWWELFNIVDKRCPERDILQPEYKKVKEEIKKC